MEEGCHGHKAAEDLFLNSQYHGHGAIAVPFERLPVKWFKTCQDLHSIT